MVRKVARFAAAVWVALAVALYWVQDAMIYPVPETSRATLDALAVQAGARILQPVSSDGTRLYAWHIPGDGSRLLLFFHGNGGGVSAAGWFAQELPGWDVVSFSYRGYPGSEGVPGEAGMARDARAIWSMVTEDLGFSPEQIVVHGQSLGGGVASHLLAEVAPAAAVFDSTFSSIEELAADRFPMMPVSLLLRSPFRSWKRARHIETPILVLHGSRDVLIPVEHGRRMAKLYSNARYFEVLGGGHDMWLLDNPDAHRRWISFVEGATKPSG